MRRKWTIKEIEILQLEYPNRPSIEIAKQLQRTLRSIYTQAKLLNIRKSDEYLLTAESGRMVRG